MIIVGVKTKKHLCFRVITVVRKEAHNNALPPMPMNTKYLTDSQIVERFSMKIQFIGRHNVDRRSSSWSLVSCCHSRLKMQINERNLYLPHDAFTDIYYLPWWWTELVVLQRLQIRCVTSKAQQACGR